MSAPIRLIAAAVAVLALAAPSAAPAAWRVPFRAAHKHESRQKHQKRRHAVRHKRRARRPAAVVRPASATPLPKAPAPAPAPAPAAAATCTDTDVIPTSATVEAARAAISCLVNNERAKAGLAALADDAQLRTAAQGHSDDMVAQAYFDHTSPDGRSMSDRIFASGYVSPTRSYSLGENIAWGGGTLGTPAQIVQAWMGSPGHRANILNGAFRDAGVGVGVGIPISAPFGGATYTQDFGAR